MLPPIIKLVKRRKTLEIKKKLIDYDLFTTNRNIHKILHACKHYHYDNAAFEENCGLKEKELDDARECETCNKYEKREAKK